jgi:hypothetical protein
MSGGKGKISPEVSFERLHDLCQISIDAAVVKWQGFGAQRGC